MITYNKRSYFYEMMKYAFKNKNMDDFKFSSKLFG